MITEQTLEVKKQKQHPKMLKFHRYSHTLTVPKILSDLCQQFLISLYVNG